MKRAIGKLPPAQRPTGYRKFRSSSSSVDTGFFYPPLKSEMKGTYSNELHEGDLERFAKQVKDDKDFVARAKDSLREFARSLPTVTMPRPAGQPHAVEELRERIKLGPLLSGNVWLDRVRASDVRASMPAETYAVARPMMAVIERSSGYETRLQGEPVFVTRAMSIKAIAEAVRDAVKKLLAHEVDEQLFVDGERAFDPHPPAPPISISFTFKAG